MMPLMLLIAIRKAPPGPVQKLMQSGATSPDTALKPGTAKITRPIELTGAVRKGIVVALPDGRYWVDVPRFKRRRLIVAILLAVAVGVTAEVAWLALRGLGIL